MQQESAVINCMKMLTYLPVEKIAEYEKLEGQEITKAKEVLAFEITKLVHGEEEAAKAQEAARAAFGGGGAAAANLPVVEIAADALQSTDKEGNQLGGLGVAAFLTKLGLTGSNRDAMDVIRQGGLKIDGEKITDPKTLIKVDSFKEDGMLVEKGKKKKIIAKLK